jgi:hypothetical protein
MNAYNAAIRNPFYRDAFQDTHKPLHVWFRAIWYITSQKNGTNALGLQRVLGLGSYKTAWLGLHKLRRVMVRRGYNEISEKGYRHEAITGGEPDAVLPHMYTIMSLIKRWILGTIPGSYTKEHLGYYFDDYTFRFNRYKSNRRGLLFYRLLENAVRLEPITYDMIVSH